MAFQKLEIQPIMRKLAGNSVRVGVYLQKRANGEPPKPQLSIRLSADIARSIGLVPPADKNQPKTKLTLALGTGADFGKLQVQRAVNGDAGGLVPMFGATGGVTFQTTRAPMRPDTVGMTAAQNVTVDGAVNPATVTFDVPRNLFTDEAIRNQGVK